MPVPTSIADLSQTAASNSPAGSDSIGTSLDDFLRAIQAIQRESGGALYTASGTDTITVTTNPTFAAYFTGLRVCFKSAGANTGAVTLNVNGLGAKAVTKGGTTALTAGDIPSGAVVIAVYDGTQFQLIAVNADYLKSSDSTVLKTSSIGVSVQGYDANTTKLNVTQTFTAPQRGSVTTDNDLSFDMAAGNNFTCTPSAGGTLTFTNITAGQSGYILLVNGSNYAIAAHANTKIATSDLTKISATGTYLISYYSNGTNVYCSASGSLA